MFEIVNKRFKRLGELEDMADGRFKPRRDLVDMIDEELGTAEDILDESQSGNHEIKEVPVAYIAEFDDTVLDVEFLVSRDLWGYYTDMDTGEAVTSNEDLEEVLIDTVAAITRGFLQALGR